MNLLLLVACILLILILVFIYKKNIIKNEYLKLLTKYFIIALSIPLLLEITIFNFRHYESIFFMPNNTNLNYKIAPGIKCKNEYCEIIDKENAYIEITNINKKVNNIHLAIQSKKKLILKYDLYYTDEANEYYFKAGSRTYAKEVTNSHYQKVNASGTIKNIKLNLKNANVPFKINNISINNKVPFNFNLFRVALLIMGFFFILVINPKNKLYEIKYNAKNTKIVTALIILLFSTIFSMSTVFNRRSFNSNPYSNYNQYQNLAVALTEGHFDLNLPVSNKLLSLKNPYDTKARDELLKRYEEYYWDYSFYNGRYYSYFGVVPCLLTYVPYYALTHENLPNVIAISIAITLFVISCFYLIYQIINKYFKNTSYIWYFLLSLFFVFASGMGSFAGEPTFYNQPIIYAVSFACLGLAFYLKSTMSNKLNAKYLFLGSLCMALVAGCRPQLLLTSFFGIIIFWDYVFKKRELFSKKSLKETILIVIPFVIIGLLLMYYNYARFGSIFDFGANYNLTTNDMTKRGFKFDRTFLGIYHFLFAPARITAIFPFITKDKIATSYLGRTIYEDLYGGFLFINLICILGLIFFKFKKIINNKELYKICATSLTIAFIIIILDTQMAGILPRYLYDFGFLICLNTIIVILSLIKSKVLNDELKKVIITFIVISLIYNFFAYFLGRNNLIGTGTLDSIFNYMYHTFMFWL